MPTGWRPADVAQKYPWQYWENAYDQTKYDSQPSPMLQQWSWVQLAVHFLLVFHVLASFVSFDYAEVLIYALFLMISIFSFTSLMDKSRIALWAESIKFLLGISLFFSQDASWFGLESLLPGLNYVMFGYMLLSLSMSFYLLKQEGSAMEKTLVFSPDQGSKEKANA